MRLASLFHPAVAAWFERSFSAPTGAQAQAWPAILAGRHALISAPTGSGKTLAAFLAAVDGLVRQGLAGAVPAHLRDAHYAGARKLQHGKGYRYPHDFPGGVVEQQYAPDTVAGRDYYRPSEQRAERAAAQRLAMLREVVRGEAGQGRPDTRTDTETEEQRSR